MELSFTVFGKPEPAGSKKAVPIGRSGRWGVVDANKNAAGWKKTVGEVALVEMNGRPLLDEPLHVVMEFLIARPMSHLLSDGESLSAEGQRRLHHAQAPDVLKLARAVEDAMTDVVYTDDSLIVKEELSKRWCRPGEKPGVRVIVEPRWPA